MATITRDTPLADLAVAGLTCDDECPSPVACRCCSSCDAHCRCEHEDPAVAGTVPDTIGDLGLSEAAIGVRACIGTRELRHGDTLYARGFRSGDRRRVLAVRIVDRTAYVRVREGWYRWRRAYCHVQDY